MESKFRVISKVKYTYFLFFIGLVFLTSCQASFGEKYSRGNLEVYFTDEMKAYVEPTADYFEANGLIQDEKHSIQLTSSALGSENPGFVLKMVLTNPDKKLTEKELQNVRDLEKDLSNEVFNDPNFHIALCNENFVEIN